jgi:hypothetical protein
VAEALLLYTGSLALHCEIGAAAYAGVAEARGLRARADAKTAAPRSISAARARVVLGSDIRERIPRPGCSVVVIVMLIPSVIAAA